MVLGQPFDVDHAAVAALPEVSEAVPVAYVLPYEPERDEAFGVTPLVSVDGGFFTRMDRPKVLEGRRPDPDRPHEIAITPPLARSRKLRVGSTLTLRGYTRSRSRRSSRAAARPLALVVDNLVAAFPGSAAARTRPVEGLRAE